MPWTKVDREKYAVIRERYATDHFPPYTTVQNRFCAWRDSGVWERIRLRAGHGRARSCRHGRVLIADS